MAKDASRPSLTLIGPAASQISPPRQLGPHGMNLWAGILAEFDIPDRAGLELLAAACACLDRAESLAEAIAVDGPVIRTRTAVRANPAVKDETAARLASVRILEKLGVTTENLRSASGRPPQGWRG